jgi:hypothetical protein
VACVELLFQGRQRDGRLRFTWVPVPAHHTMG